MELKDIDEILLENLEQYDRSLRTIKHCLTAYEQHCTKLISEVALATSLTEADSKFDTLLAIQGELCGVFYGSNIAIGKKLEHIVHEFDRLYDPYTREYWFKKFKAGEKWPDST